MPFEILAIKPSLDQSKKYRLHHIILTWGLVRQHGWDRVDVSRIPLVVKSTCGNRLASGEVFKLGHSEIQTRPAITRPRGVACFERRPPVYSVIGWFAFAELLSCSKHNRSTICAGFTPSPPCAATASGPNYKRCSTGWLSIRTPS